MEITLNNISDGTCSDCDEYFEDTFIVSRVDPCEYIYTDSTTEACFNETVPSTSWADIIVSLSYTGDASIDEVTVSVSYGLGRIVSFNKVYTAPDRADCDPSSPIAITLDVDNSGGECDWSSATCSIDMV
jgi:hypothetical protein